MTYRPRAVSQIDGTKWQWLDCMAAGGAMALDRDTLGVHRTTAINVRNLSGDTSGGMDFAGVQYALHRIDGQYHLQVYGKLAVSTAIAKLKAGRGFMSVVNYGVIVDSGLAYQSLTFRGRHQIFINELNVATARWAAGTHALGYDPLLDARRPGIPQAPIWYPLDVLYKAWASLSDVGTGYVQAAFTVHH